MRAVLAVAVVLGWVSPALAADSYVRNDGSDLNTGTANSAAGAWRTIGKCAGLAKAGDRCLVQPGVYLETGVTQANPGSLVASAVNTCDCTHGAAAITCSGAISAQVAAGRFVRCAGGHGFAWSRVESIAGSTVTLAEPYRGPTLGAAPLDVAAFVEILGQGHTPREVTLSEFRARPSTVTWEKDPTHGCLWRYPKASAVDPTWKMPTGFREDVPDTAWNLFVEQKNGRDLYYRLWANGQAPAGSGGDCPCQAGAVQEQVQTVPGSWGDDATFVYVQTRGCKDPTGLLVAGRHGSGGELGGTLISRQPFTIVEGLAVDVGGFDYAAASSQAHGFVLGASNARYSRLHQEGGRFEFLPPAGSVDTLYEHLRTLGGTRCQLSTGHSGLALYDVEIRGGSPSGLSCGAISGAADGDPIVFDRLYQHRSFPELDGVASCGGAATWDCTAHTFKPCPTCANQDPRLLAGGGVSIGNESVDNATDHLLLRNSIVEVSTGGWGAFHGGGGKDVVFVNNTFGVNHRLDDGLKAELGSAGANGSWGATLFNNLFVLGAGAQGGLRYNGTKGTLVSDYNLFLPFQLSGNTRVWGVGETLEVVIGSYGAETHSALVCSSGCAGAHGKYFNDNGESGLTDVSVLDGTPTDYSPKAGFRGLDVGDSAHCPAEDFLGHPRSDGKCDIGAIERQAAPPGVDAGSPEVDATSTVPDVGQLALDAAEGVDAEGGPDATSEADAAGKADAHVEGLDAAMDASAEPGEDAAQVDLDAASGNVDASLGPDGGSASSPSRGCGCGTSAGPSLGLTLVALAFLRRKRALRSPG